MLFSSEKEGVKKGFFFVTGKKMGREH